MSKLTREAIQADMDACPAIAALGMKVTLVEGEKEPVVELRMPLSDASRRSRDEEQFHGGAIASLADTAGDYAVAAAVGGGVPTINMRIDFLRPAAGAELRALARVRRIGRTVAIVDVEITDLNKRVCALGRATYATTIG